MSLSQKNYAERESIGFLMRDWFMENITSIFIMTHDQLDCYLQK